MSDTTVTGWAGWGVFASVLLLIAGIFDLIFGIAAIIGPNSTLVITGDGLFAVDVAAWGWWHILSGVLLILISFALYRGMHADKRKRRDDQTQFIALGPIEKS